MEIAVVDEQQFLAACRERGEQGTERNGAPIDGDENAQVEPIAVVGVDGRHGERRNGGELTIIGPVSSRADTHTLGCFEARDRDRRELGGGNAVQVLRV